MAQEQDPVLALGKIMNRRQKISALTDTQLISQFNFVHELLKRTLKAPERKTLLTALVDSWLRLRMEVFKRKKGSLIARSRLDYSKLREVLGVERAIHNFLIRFGHTPEGKKVRRLIKAPPPRLSPQEQQRNRAINSTTPKPRRRR